MLTNTPPRYSGWADMLRPIRKGEIGWRAYAVQRVVGVSPDGHWGAGTQRAVKRWQRTHGLTADAIVGGATQARMLEVKAAVVEKRFAEVIPAGLLDGFARVEGANILAATNTYTPPGGREGTDCGPAQWRILVPYSVDELMSAFSPTGAFSEAAKAFSERIDRYRRMNPRLSVRRVIEAAVLAHNWPVGAEQVVRNGGEVSFPHNTAVWTRKADGTHYTQGEWSYAYPHKVLDGVMY